LNEDGQGPSSVSSLDPSRTSEGLHVFSKHKSLTFICLDCGKQWVHQVDCGDRLCPECNRRRGRRVISRYSSIIASFQEPKWLTLTLQRRPLTRGAVRNLRSCFRKLRQNKVWDSGSKGIYCLESGEIDDLGCCNLHIHVLMDSKFIEQKKLSEAWKRITKDSYIVDIRPANRVSCDHRALLRYMTKYMVKMPRNLLEWKAKLYNVTFHGTRLIQVFGFSRGGYQLDIHQPVCPYCGGTEIYCLDYEPSLEGQSFGGFSD
jgi:hypothetical protein